MGRFWTFWDWTLWDAVKFWTLWENATGLWFWTLWDWTLWDTIKNELCRKKIKHTLFEILALKDDKILLLQEKS